MIMMPSQQNRPPYMPRTAGSQMAAMPYGQPRTATPPVRAPYMPPVVGPQPVRPQPPRYDIGTPENPPPRWGLDRGGTIADPGAYERDQQRRQEQAEMDRYRREIQAREQAERERQLEAQRKQQERESFRSQTQQDLEQQQRGARMWELSTARDRLMENLPAAQERFDQQALRDWQFRQQLQKDREAFLKQSLRKDYDKTYDIGKQREAIMQSYAGRGMYGSDAMKRELADLEKNIPSFDEYIESALRNDPEMIKIRSGYQQKTKRRTSEFNRAFGQQALNSLNRRISGMGYTTPRSQPLGRPAMSTFQTTPTPEWESYQRWLEMMGQGDPRIVAGV